MDSKERLRFEEERKGSIYGRALKGFLAQGLQRTSAGLSSVIIDSQPLSVAVLASLLFGESIGLVGAATIRNQEDSSGWGCWEKHVVSWEGEEKGRRGQVVDEALAAVAPNAIGTMTPHLPRLSSNMSALVLEVCDETEIAELKLKVGDFEMHMKRNIGATKAPMSNISPTTPPPIPTMPMEVLAPAAATVSPPKATSEKATPIKTISYGNSSKLTDLEASGASGYVPVSSPTVGSF